MKRIGIISIILAISLALTSCGGNSNNGVSESNTANTENDTVGTSDIPSTSSTDSTGSVTEDFLKTITAETATAQGTCGANLTWYYKDNVLVIKGTGEMTDYSQGFITKAPWGVDSEDKLYEKINWVIVDEGVTSIGEKAFLGCKTLSKVILPSTLKTINFEAFAVCQELQEVTFLGEITEGFEVYSVFGVGSDAPDNLTIYYSSSTFDKYLEANSGTYVVEDINWVKQ